MIHTDKRRKARARYSRATPLMNKVLSMPDYLLWETGIIFRRPKARKSSNSHRILVFAEKSGI